MSEATEPTEKCVLQVYITKSGTVRVEGLINDEVLAYGLLEKAKMEIAKHNAPKIMAPNGNMLSALRNEFKH